MQNYRNYRLHYKQTNEKNKKALLYKVDSFYTTASLAN